MLVAFRVDSSWEIGTGHVMRCLTLANLLKKRGAHCSFIFSRSLGEFNEKIRASGHAVLLMPEASSDNLSSMPFIQNEAQFKSSHAGWSGRSILNDAELTLESLANARWDWLVVDHYGLDARWENMVAAKCSQLAVLDDLADRPHKCDLLVDPGVEPDLVRRYQGLLEPKTLILIGPQFAILRPEFDEARQRVPKKISDLVPYSLRRVLLMFGGQRASTDTLEALNAIAETSFSLDRIDVVMSSQRFVSEKLREHCESDPHVTLHVSSSQIADLMSRADLVIGSGGGATWERLYLRKPAVLKVVAKNQKKVLEHMRDSGWLDLYRSKADLISRLEDIWHSGLRSPPDVVRNGADFIAKVICDRLIQLRPVRGLDIRNTFKWIKNPELRRLFLFRGEIPTRTEHVNYWRKLLGDKSQIAYSVFRGTRHIGHAGIRNIENDAKEAELWLYLGSNEERGLGYGKIVLRQLEAVMMGELNTRLSFLRVSRSNKNAICLYSGVGYTEVGDSSERQRRGIKDSEILLMRKEL